MALLLLDIGNTNTHIGLWRDGRIVRHKNLPTSGWASGKNSLAGWTKVEGAAICSVVPKATPHVVKKLTQLSPFLLTHKTANDLGIDYPKPETIGPDRLANAIAAKHHFGSPVVVVDFGTAVTFDVVNAKGSYIGGIIAPGLAALTDYLHEKTALLPKIRIRNIKTCVGKSTEEAMLIGAVHGYRGLIRELIKELKVELAARKLPIVATGGYAKLIASGLPEVAAVRENLTLEGLRLAWEGQRRTSSLATLPSRTRIMRRA